MLFLQQVLKYFILKGLLIYLPSALHLRRKKEKKLFFTLASFFIFSFKVNCFKYFRHG